MKDNNFTSGSILKKLVKFMFPILGSLVLQAMYGAVDLLVVGRFGTTAGLSGVSTGSQVLNLVTFVMTGLSMGVTVEIGHAIGEERRDRIGPVIGGSVLVFGLISIVLCVIMVPFARTIAVLMQAPQEAVDLTAQYIRICGAGIFFIIAYNLISAIFRGLGDSHTPLLFVLIACIINVIGDLVLVAGDIFTSTYDGLREPERYSAALAGIRAPLGVYAVYGNHDVSERLFAGFAIRPVSEAFRPPEMEQFFADSGFTVLTDEHVSLLDGRFTLVGRLDESKAGDGTSNRLSVSELLADTDKDSLLLVLEHEPVEYDALWEQGVDMVFSGHTHNGQIFPGNLYVNLMNRNAYGRVTIGSMETFVTSGVGTFGPPMRTGTNSEIMIIDVMYTP